MKHLIILLCFMSLTLIACDEPHQVKSGKCELRQLISKEIQTSSSSGSFFLIAASYSSSSKSENIVKMFAKVDGKYRLISCPLEDVRIEINDNITIPYVVALAKLVSSRKITDEEVFDWRYGNTYTITCPQKYLPEKLLPIELK